MISLGNDIMLAELPMAQLIVRDIENEVKAKLQRRAKRHGRSMEEEVREILRDATKAETSSRKGLGTRIAEHFREFGLKEGEEIREFHDLHIEPAKFDE
jgi:plasmid stability protein